MRTASRVSRKKQQPSRQSSKFAESVMGRFYRGTLNQHKLAIMLDKHIEEVFAQCLGAVSDARNSIDPRFSITTQMGLQSFGKGIRGRLCFIRDERLKK